MIIYFKVKTLSNVCIYGPLYCRGQCHQFIIMRVYSKDDKYIKQDEFFCNSFTACERHGATEDEDTDVLETTPTYFFRLFKKESINKKLINKNSLTVEYLQSFL